MKTLTLILACVAGASHAMQPGKIIRPPARLYMEAKYQRADEQIALQENASCITSAFKNIYQRFCTIGSKYIVNCMPNEKLKPE